MLLVLFPKNYHNSNLVWYNLAKSGRSQMTDKWLTIDQIAEYLQASKEKIYKLCQRGKMPASKFGGEWRFKKDLVDRWLLQSLSKKKDGHLKTHRGQKK